MRTKPRRCAVSRSGVKKLEGRTNTLKKRKCPPSAKIIDDAKVPAEFKHITVTLPLPQWQEPLSGSGEEFRKAVLSGIRKQETCVALDTIKQALNLEKTVEGRPSRSSARAGCRRSPTLSADPRKGGPRSPELRSCQACGPPLNARARRLCHRVLRPVSGSSRPTPASTRPVGLSAVRGHHSSWSRLANQKVRDFRQQQGSSGCQTLCNLFWRRNMANGEIRELRLHFTHPEARI
jgi:hypothetical protein